MFVPSVFFFFFSFKPSKSLVFNSSSVSSEISDAAAPAAFAFSLLASSPSAFNRSNASFSLNICFATLSAISIAISFGVFGDGAATALVI